MSTFTRLAASVALGAGIAASVLYAPTAQADSSSFLDQIHDLGWVNRVSGDVGLLNQGYAVCRAIEAGANGTQVAAVIYNNTDLSVDRADAVEFVIISVTNLCPEYDHRGEGLV